MSFKSVALVAPLGLVLLSACSSPVPDSGAGVGFNDYNSYMNSPQPAPVPVAPAATAPAAGTFNPATAAAAIDRASGGTPSPGQPPLQAAGTIPATPAPLPAAAPVAAASGAVDPAIDCSIPEGIRQTTSEMDGVAAGGVSDEQDFGAVSARETIESDKRRIACNRARLQVDQPGAVPQRQGDTGPNLAQFALSTTHDPGTQVYRRSGLQITSMAKACARYTSSEKAQEDFLRMGGPERDRKGLDPDGDGFACYWDPRPLRAALQ